jgi:hypothetical protein
MVTKFAELPADAQAFMDALLDGYLDQVGHPPGMTRSDAKRAMITLVERGEAKMVQHGDPADPACSYSLQLTASATRAWSEQIAPVWTGDQRADGVEVREMLNGAYEIVRPGSPAVDRCYCCGAILLTARAAKLVADRMYPFAAANVLREAFDAN